MSVFLVFLIGISGCSFIPANQPVSVANGNGIIIESFEPVIKNKLSNEPVAFRVKIKNTGTETAYDVEAKLTNIGDFDIYNDPVQFFPELPSDTLNSGNSPKLTWSWDLDAPFVPSGTTIKFNPSLRVTYTYKTETVKSISLVPEVELRALQNSGRTLPAETISSSRAPVSLDIEIKGPLRYYDNVISFPLSIILRNNGGGVLCRDKCQDSAKDYNVLDVYLHDTDVKLKDCSTHDIRMTGDTATIVCTAEIKYDYTKNNDNAELAIKKNIGFDTVYTYTTDKTTELTVVGK